MRRPEHRSRGRSELGSEPRTYRARPRHCRTLSFKGHDVDVNSVAFSPDGSLLATTGDDGALKVWDPDSGELVSSVTEEGPVWGPSFSADGSLVSASWTEKGSVRVMDSDTGRVVSAIEGIETGPFDTDLSPDGARVAATEIGDRFIRVFDVDSRRQLFRLRGLRYGASTVAWDPTGRRLATAANDGSVYIWDGRNGKQLFELIGHTGLAITVDWSPDAKRLLSGGSDGTARVWELRAHGTRQLMSLSATDTRNGALAAFSPDGRHVITGDFGIQAAKIWDVGPSGDAEWAGFPTDELAPVAVALLPNGDVVAPIKRGSAAIWDIETGERESTWGLAHDPGSALVEIAVAPDGTRVAGVPNFSRDVTVWDPSTGAEVFHADVGTEISAAAWSPDSRTLALGAGSSLLLFDREGELIQRVDAGAQALRAVGFSPAGDLLVTGGIDEVQEGHGKLTWWTVNGESRVEKRDEIDVDSEVSALAFDREGMTVATAQLRGSVETYAVDDGEMLTRFSPQSGPVSDVEFSIVGNRRRGRDRASVLGRNGHGEPHLGGTRLPRHRVGVHGRWTEARLRRRRRNRTCVGARSR